MKYAHPPVMHIPWRAIGISAAVWVALAASIFAIVCCTS